ncbi:MAG: exopolyphosphatase [Pseudomonadota bacterium]
MASNTLWLDFMKNLLAAVDLGSNSFRLSIGRVAEQNGTKHIYQIDRLKETVRLAAGLDSAKMLNQESINRAIEVLHIFGDRLRTFHPDRVRAVATNTFRVARNVADFLPEAEAALGFPIEVIAGREEARLIYTGVSHTLPVSQTKRLVVDIGGGSTEVIIGKGDEPVLMSSLYMGCVSFSRKFFPDGKIDAYSLKLAEVAARREIEPITKPYRKMGWDVAYGSSGTAKALYAILTEGKFSKDGITRDGLERLKAKLVRSGRVIPDQLPGIKTERAEVLTGGLAIMSAFFDEMGVERMQTGDGALRLGVLVDLAGREESHDRRDQTVAAFVRRYHVDARQATRVKRCALTLFESLFPERGEQDELKQTVRWAATLHEVGVSIAQAGYHKHSAYILNNADMPGFSKIDQESLGLLALAHTGKLSRADALIKTKDQWLAILCLRLAVLLCRRREDVSKLPLTISVKSQTITCKVDKKWLASHPLTDFSLHGEEDEWAKIGYKFELIPV